MAKITLKILNSQTGGCSAPSKMPGLGWSISASKCMIGSKLRKVKGSVCSKCYALKGRYVFDNTKAAHERRLQAFNTNPTLWVDAMALTIERTNQSFFRWFDSGDLQSVLMLASIVEVAKRTPGTQHWLPTKEYGIVREYLDNGGMIPANLNIRFSAYKLGGKAPTVPTNCTASTVDGGGFACPATRGLPECDAHNCRACWDKSVAVVDYAAH